MDAQPEADRFLILILGVLTALGPLSIDLYLPAFPLIATDFSASPAGVELSLASFFMGLALGQLLSGLLSDRLGRRPTVLLGLSVYAIASTACAGAQSLEFLITARFTQALGACAAIVVARAVVRDRFRAQESARVFSMLMLVMGIAPILAPLVGGVVSQLAGWRALFVLLTANSLLCLAAVFKLLPETRPTSVETSRIFQVLRDRAFVGYALAGGLAYAGMFAYITGSSFVFMDLFGISSRRFGFVFGTNAAGLIAGSQLNRRLLLKHEMKCVLRRAFMALAVAGSLLALAGCFGFGFWGVAVPLWAYVGILGMTYPNTTALALQNQGAQAGTASACLGTIQFSFAAGAAWMVSRLHDGSALAMSTVVGGCGIFAFLIHLVLVHGEQTRAASNLLSLAQKQKPRLGPIANHSRFDDRVDAT